MPTTLASLRVCALPWYQAPAPITGKNQAASATNITTAAVMGAQLRLEALMGNWVGRTQTACIYRHVRHKTGDDKQQTALEQHARQAPTITGIIYMNRGDPGIAKGCSAKRRRCEAVAYYIECDGHACHDQYRRAECAQLEWPWREVALVYDAQHYGRSICIHTASINCAFTLSQNRCRAEIMHCSKGLPFLGVHLTEIQRGQH